MSQDHIGLIASQFTATPALGLAHDRVETDAAIELTVRSILAEPTFARLGYVDVSVDAGNVTLAGTVSDGLSLARLKNRITSLNPAATIDDRTDWVVPDCGIGVV